MMYWRKKVKTRTTGLVWHNLEQSTVIVKILEVAFTQILNNYRVVWREIFELYLVDSN